MKVRRVLHYINRYIVFKINSFKKKIKFFLFCKRKMLIYGNERLKKDFKYMFPKVNIKGEIFDSIVADGKNNYLISNLNDKLLKKYFIIVCERKNEEVYNILKKNNLVEEKNYLFLEDIAHFLNDDKDLLGEVLLKRILNHYDKPYFENYINNEELFRKMIYTNSYERKFCKEPFVYSNIQPNGYLYSCCPSWGYNKMGNVLFKSPKKIWNSNAVKLQRLAILNKSFAFCSSDSCPLMSNENLKDKKITNEYFKDVKLFKSPQKLYIAIDESCNLKCKSCRKELYSAKGFDLKFRMYVAKKMVNSNWCNSAKRLVIAGQGEVFFSKVYNKMVFHSRIRKRDTIEFLTNGILLTKQKLDEVCKIYKNVNICVTIDAATEETYKKLRIGGNYKKLCENLEYISQMRKEGRVKNFQFLFVVQKENYKEMPEFIEMAKKYSVDEVRFSQISNWGTYTKKEFKKVSMLDENENPKIELKKVLQNKAFRNANMSKFSYVLKFDQK